MLTGLVLGMWLSISSIPIDPAQSFDYLDSTHTLCQVDITCGSGIIFTHWSQHLSDLGEIAAVGPKLYSITHLPLGTIHYDGTGLAYNTHGLGQFGNVWTVQTSNLQNFIFLRSISNDFYVAIEDLPPSFDWYGTTRFTDFDYNDAMYQVIPTPEPASLLLLGTGLGVLARMRRKQMRRAASGAQPGTNA